MKLTGSDRGLSRLVHPTYTDREQKRLLQISSASGSPHLWFGADHHLDRDEVAQVVGHMQAWLATGSLELPKDDERLPTDIISDLEKS